MLRRGFALLVLPLLLLGLLAGCSDEDSAEGSGRATDDSAPAAATGPEPPMAFPGAAWEVASPAAAGMDPARLDELADLIGENSQCLTVVRDGQVVYDRAWFGDTETDSEAFSATKSITSTLVGIAVADGLLELDQPVSDFVPEWAGTESEEVTVRNLLANDSGRYYDFQTDYSAMASQAEDKTAFAIALEQQHPVGEHWEYNNSAIQVLEQVLQVATGQEVAELAEERLFAPLGMTSEIRRDQAGNTLVFMGAQTSCHDLARFGHLFLNEGEWDGEQIVPAEWVAEATSPSQDLNPGYGLLWWLFPEGSTVVEDGQPAPPAAFAALGLGGQIVLVVPDDGLVITRMGPARLNGPGQGALVAPLLSYAHQAVVEGED